MMDLLFLSVIFPLPRSQVISDISFYCSFLRFTILIIFLEKKSCSFYVILVSGAIPVALVQSYIMTSDSMEGTGHSR